MKQLRFINGTKQTELMPIVDGIIPRKGELVFLDVEGFTGGYRVEDVVYYYKSNIVHVDLK